MANLDWLLENLIRRPRRFCDQKQRLNCPSPEWRWPRMWWLFCQHVLEASVVVSLLMSIVVVPIVAVLAGICAIEASSQRMDDDGDGDCRRWRRWWSVATADNGSQMVVNKALQASLVDGVALLTGTANHFFPLLPPSDPNDGFSKWQIDLTDPKGGNVRERSLLAGEKHRTRFLLSPFEGEPPPSPRCPRGTGGGGAQPPPLQPPPNLFLKFLTVV